MTLSQLAAITYRLGVIDNAHSQIHVMIADLEEIGESDLSVKLELATRLFEERSNEYRTTIDKYADEIPTDTAPSREGRQAATC